MWYGNKCSVSLYIPRLSIIPPRTSSSYLRVNFLLPLTSPLLHMSDSEAIFPFISFQAAATISSELAVFYFIFWWIHLNGNFVLQSTKNKTPHCEFAFGANWVQTWFENIQNGAAASSLEVPKSWFPVLNYSERAVDAGRQGEMVTGGGREGEFEETRDIMKDCCTLPCNQAAGTQMGGGLSRLSRNSNSSLHP